MLVLRFTSKASNKLIQLLKERFEQASLIIIHEHRAPGDVGVTLSLTCQATRLERQAENIRLTKRVMEHNVMDYFVMAERHRFCDPNATHRDKDGLWTANDCALLMQSILDAVQVLPQGQFESELSKILDVYHAEYVVELPVDKSVAYAKARNKISEESERKLKEFGAHSLCLRHVLQTYGLLDVVAPVPLAQVSNVLIQQTWWPWYQTLSPIDSIQEYYGWDVGFYAAWMGFWTRALILPAVFGSLVTAARIYRGKSIDEDEYTPFHGIITFVWSVFIMRFWDRYEHTLSYRWGTHSLSLYEGSRYRMARPQFFGYLRISPVTGEPETYFPAARRRLKYVVSGFVTLLMLLVAFAVMILSLNCQGYIRPRAPTLNSLRRQNSPQYHPFHVRSLSSLADTDEVFDASSPYKSLLPVALHVVAIYILNKLYSSIAKMLTEWENHETDLHHQNSLVMKRFLFEAFDCYVALFYLAFYERDEVTLRQELIAIFQVDTFRRLALECVIPTLGRMWKHRRLEPATDRWDSVVKALTPPTLEDVTNELDKEVYDSFDDYMEIVIQIGYVTLFASAFPVGSVLAVLANMIEIRTDMYKLAHIVQKPFSFRSTGIGMWKTLLATIIWMSALTNCLIAGFTSTQLLELVPKEYIYYELDGEGNADMERSRGWMIVFVIFGLERILLCIGILVYWIVPEVPEHVADALARRAYLHRKKEIAFHVKTE